MKKHLMLPVLVFLLPACSHLDNFMLGKDNTPTPSALKPIKQKVKLKQTWTVPLHSKTNASLKFKPEVVENTVYAADSSGFIQAVDKTSGQLLWSKKLDHGIISGPAVSSGRMVVATDASTVTLLSQRDGRELWSSKVSGEVLSKPVITNNKVIAKTIDGNLYAFDLASGKQIWLSEHGAPGLILKASSSPVVVDNKLVLAGYSDGKMDAVDLQTGHLVWQRSLAYANGASDVERLVDIDADPIIRDNVAYLATYQGYVVALSLTDGQFIWRKPLSVYKNMVIDHQALYLTDSNDVVWSINRHTGRVNWKQLALKARGLTEPVLQGNRLLIGDKIGLLHVLATNNGELISREQLAGAINSAPSISGKNIYVLTNNGHLNHFAVS